MCVCARACVYACVVRRAEAAPMHPRAKDPSRAIRVPCCMRMCVCVYVCVNRCVLRRVEAALMHAHARGPFREMQLCIRKGKNKPANLAYIRSENTRPGKDMAQTASTHICMGK